MATLSSVLAQIRQNESGSAAGNYTAQNPTSTASGAYQFVNGTWQSLTQKSGIGTQYATAGSAPPNVQDAVAAYALEQNPNANSCSLWGTCDAAGNVIGPARYATIDNYDTSSQALLAGSGYGTQAAQGDTTGQGYGSVGTNGYNSSGDPNTVIDPTTGEPIGGGTTLGTGVGGASGYTSGQASTMAQAGSAAVGATNIVGLGSGLATTATGWINQIETSIGNWMTNATKAVFGQAINWFSRGFLIVIGLVILAIALWRLMDPGGEKTAALLKGAPAEGLV